MFAVISLNLQFLCQLFTLLSRRRKHSSFRFCLVSLHILLFLQDPISTLALHGSVYTQVALFIGAIHKRIITMLLALVVPTFHHSTREVNEGGL